ncbi:MAG: hypothetical protein GXO10_04505 [Crenarchaeota archaeon]|nr:hypothetical protein [Thermoproteota archaeon]
MKIEVKDQILKHLENNHIKNDFEKWYRKYRLVITDLVLVRRLSTYIREEIEELKRRGVEINDSTKKIIADTWIRALEKLEIDRYSIIRGELNGLNKDVLDILLILFPNVRHYSRKPFTTVVEHGHKRRCSLKRVGKIFRIIKENITPSSVFLCILFIITLTGLILLTLKNINIRKNMSNISNLHNVTKIVKINSTKSRTAMHASSTTTLLCELCHLHSILMFLQIL